MSHNKHAWSYIMTYQKYIRSAKWKKFRSRFLELNGSQCSVCGSKYRLEVHHLSYKNLGNESLTAGVDCKILCRYHHGELHAGLKRFAIFNSTGISL